MNEKLPYNVHKKRSLQEAIDQLCRKLWYSMNYNVNYLSAILKSGEKRKNEFKIGVEIEHFVVDQYSWESNQYYQENGIETILNKLMKFDYLPRYEEGHLISLEKEDAVITIEPGGQLEISIKPCLSLRDIELIYFNFLKEIIPILEKQNQFLLSLGYHPKSKINEIPFIPKERYKLMSAYFKKKGKYAHHMMKGTAALQVSIDYQNEEDFAKKLKVANFISPLLAIISDNSPIFEGKAYQQNCLRSLIWQNTDVTRSGAIPGIMDKPFGYREYADYILNAEPILFIKDNAIVDAANLKGFNVLDQYSLTHNEIIHLFSMVFPVARARNYIEIRPGDSLPYPFSFSYIALIKGLFYDDDALDYLFGLAGDIDSGMHEKNMAAMMLNGLHAEFGSTTVSKIMPDLFGLARAGLPAEEKHYLQPLEELIASQKNVSRRAKEKLLQEGFEGLRLWTLNNCIQEDNFHADKYVVRSV